MKKIKSQFIKKKLDIKILINKINKMRRKCKKRDNINKNI